MKKLKITKAWPSGNGLMQPGEYRIPGDVSLSHAKCAQADGCGEIVEAGNFRKRGRPPKKQAAPENKLGDPASGNKADLGGADGGGGGERAEPQRGSSGESTQERPADSGDQ